MNKRIRIEKLFLLGLIGLSSYGNTALAAPRQPFMKDVDSVLFTRPTYELSVGALYLQPSSTNLDYAVYGFPFPTVSPHWQVQAVKPRYTFGYHIYGRYNIPCTDLDLFASWDHLRTSDSDSTQAGSGQFVVFPFQAGPSAGQDLNNPSQLANSNARFDYDLVNLDVGKTVHYGPCAKMRFFIGISWAQIRQKLDTTFNDLALTYSINSINNSRFTGVGPLIGIDASYQLPCSSFNIFASLATSALIGNINAVTDYISSSPTLAALGITTNYQNISPKNSPQVVPSLGGKLGIGYSYATAANPTVSNPILLISIGYEYTTYFNAIATYNPTTVFGNVNTGAIALSSLGKTVSNFNVSGPFVDIGIKFC